jgi:uncharacterized protein
VSAAALRAFLAALGLVASLPASGETLEEAVASAQRLEDEGRFAEAASLLEAHAGEVDGEAAYMIAQDHLFAVVNGIGPGEAGKADVSAARRWIDRALELGNPAAYQLLYTIYSNGFGVPEDMDKAVEYLRLGEAKDDPGSKLNLAVLAYRGIPPVAKDVPFAAKYFAELARQDPPQIVAVYYTGVIMFKGEAGPRDERGGLALIETAAQHGVADAERDMGKALEYGWAGRERDLPAALGWYGKAAEHGDYSALWRLGLAHAQGDFGRVDAPKAVAYFRQAVDAGSRNAMTSLGVMYATGEGVPQDFSEARRWYEQAAELGDPQALKNLAVMYARGEDVDVDLVRAHGLASDARDAGNEEAVDLLRMIEEAMTPAQREEVRRQAAPVRTP